MGHLPEALVNYLGMMGWTMPSGEEKFSIQEMTDQFDINRVSLGGPIFDLEKLNWLNGKYIREELSDEEFVDKYAKWAFPTNNLKNLIPLVRERVDKFSDVIGLIHFFLSSDVGLTEESFEEIKLDRKEVGSHSAKKSLEAINRVDSILGVLDEGKDLDIDDNIKALIDERCKA